MRYYDRLLAVCLVMSPSAISASAADGDKGEFSIRATLPLNAAQRERLREIVAADAEAGALMSQLEAEAKGFFDLVPRPLPRIEYEGLLNTDPRRIEAVSHLRQLDAAAALLHYWQATESDPSATALRRLIMAWAETYRPTGNDVNENKLYPLFVAYEGLRHSFAPKDRATIDAWIRRLGELHQQQVGGQNRLTNRYTKSVRLLAIFGRILDREDWREASREGLKRFVAASLRPDGTSYDLEHRDSLTYHNSALRPMIELAVLAGDEGPELYTWSSEAGGSLKRSVDYVRPYASGEKQRKEWVNSRVQLDHQRAAAGIESYRRGRLFDPSDALRLLEEASYFDPTLTPLVLKLHGGQARRFASWTMVVNAACGAVR